MEDLRLENRRLVEDELQREVALDDPALRIYELIKAEESERLEFKATVRWKLRENRASSVFSILKEDFFIRTGPASRKLKPSQIIKYLAGRKI